MAVEPNLRPRNAGALLGWPVVVALLAPLVAGTVGPRGGHLAAVLAVAAATATFARYGFLGVLRADCESCGGRVAVGGLYCPRCGALRTRFAAPLVQGLLAVLVLPYGWFVVAGLTSRVLLALAGAVPALSVYGTFYGAGGVVAASAVLAATVVVPVAVVAGCKVGARVLAARRGRASGSGG